MINFVSMLTVRQAFKNLLDLHVLFAAAQTVDADGAPLPIASISLSLDDEVQYRCAGYIQAEIERYTDTFEAVTEDDEEAGKESGAETGEEDQGDDAEGKKANIPKRKLSLVESMISLHLLVIRCTHLLWFQLISRRERA